jgi:hypothetical protein
VDCNVAENIVRKWGLEVGSSTFVLCIWYLIQYLIEGQAGFLLLCLLINVMVGISNCPYFYILAYKYGYESNGPEYKF